MSALDKQDRLPRYAFLDENRARDIAQATREGIYNLLPTERFWQERQPYLHKHGYQLRPRYLPGWQPSWRGTRIDPTYCEDSIMLINFEVIDARRGDDDRLVAIKTVLNDSEESRIASYLSSITDTQNHCVPVYEILPDPFDPSYSLMVMSYLRPCQDPPLSTIGDIIEFVNQTLQGLVFMHKHGVAHRDIAFENIMVDAASLYPDGHHPVRRWFSPDGAHEVTPLPRAGRSITYYYIDFGLSLRFPPGTTPSAIGRVGRDKDAPELSSTVAYDPFKIDIFALGNLYSQEFEQKYNSMQFLVPLIEKMRRTSPASRPTALELLAQWEEIRADLRESLYRWRLGSKSEPAIERMFNDTFAVAREGIYHLKKFVV
ncbi:kinase-like domain-containing protein [Trametes elegans]|nr:kinase-like domain-containing protein [Trametes elegans]